MNDWLEILKQLGIQIAPWMIVVVLVIYIFRERLSKGLNILLDRLSTVFRGEWSYRRFEHEFRAAIRAMHLYMRVVGIRSEKGREPTIPEAYVPLRLASYVGENVEDIDSHVSNRDAQREFLPVEDILQQHTTLVVLGNPGAGKSTLLKHLIISFTEPHERERAYNTAPRTILALKRPQQSRPFVPYPLYVPLRACREQNETLLKDILDPETKILASMLPSEQRKKMPQGFIEHCIQKGSAILLLDGLDELVNEEMYTDVVRKINDFHLSYPENRVVVTCRIAGWHSGLRSEFAVYRALPLDRQQQQDFIDRWYLTAYKQSGGSNASTLLEEEKAVKPVHLSHEREQGARDEADALQLLLRERERLAELAANPMLLSLICLVYHLRRDLPRGRTALYDECVQILLGVWDSIDKGLKITKPTMDEKRKILRHVAYLLHNSGQKDISRQDFVRLVMSDLGTSEEDARIIVRQIEVRSWLIVERVTDRFTFSHLTLQEFFVVEYLNIEKHGEIRFEAIKDWNRWREPVLLMCGKSADPTTFIENLASHNILLALLCIAEADNTLLDIQRIQNLLNLTLKQVREGRLVLIDLIPILVSLLTIDGSPFSIQMMDFMKAYSYGLDKEGRLHLITAIANNRTREAARLLLYLCQAWQIEWPDVLNGLLFIGGPAVEEVLQLNRNRILNDAGLAEFLLRSYTPEATKALWERYGLGSKIEMQESLLAWAGSWACRLALPENERLMRAIPYNGPIDFELWPYRRSQHTALAAVTQRCVQIFRDRYSGEEYGNTAQKHNAFVSIVEYIAQFDLRVQIPVLVRLKFPVSSPKDEDDEIRLKGALAFPLDWAWSSCIKCFKERAWLGVMLAGTRGIDTVRQNVFWLLSIFGVLVSAAAAWMGVILLLWNVLPIWLSVTFFALFSVSFIVSIIISTYASLINTDTPTDGCIGVTMVLIFILFLNLFIFFLIGDGKIYAHLKITGKINFWFPVALLIAVVGNGVLGGFTVHAWFHIALPLSMFIIGFIGLLGSMFAEWATAFTEGAMHAWLMQRPQGKVVLDELSKRGKLSL